MKVVRENINELKDWILTIEDLAELLSRTQIEKEISQRAYLIYLKEVREKRGDAGVVKQFNKTIKDITVKVFGPGKYKIYYDFMNENIDDNIRSPKWRQVKKHLMRWGWEEAKADAEIDTFIRNAPYEVRNRYREDQPVNVAIFIKNAAENYWHGVYESDDEVRFSGAPEFSRGKFKKPIKKMKDDGTDPMDKYAAPGRGPKTYRGKATKDEFNKALGKPLGSDKPVSKEGMVFTPREWGRHVKPFKEKVTNLGLLSKFDELGPEEARRRLLLALDSIELPNSIRINIEQKILKAADALSLANLILKYTIDYRHDPDKEPFQYNKCPECDGAGCEMCNFTGEKSINLYTQQHTGNMNSELDKIRRS